jgi:large subunit ribosomal protein L10Ae
LLESLLTNSSKLKVKSISVIVQADALIGLKNYNPQQDTMHRFGTVKFVICFLLCWTSLICNLPHPHMSICILADAADIDCAKQIKLEYMSVDDPKKYVCNLI